MEPEGSLPNSKVPATCPYPEPTIQSLQFTATSYSAHKLWTNVELNLPIRISVVVLADFTGHYVT
jgi:hypothetical protein